MRANAARGMSWLLIACGLVNMVFPLWLAVRAVETGAELPLAGLAGDLFPVGLTAIPAGLALLLVLDRLDGLTRTFSEETLRDAQHLVLR